MLTFVFAACGNTYKQCKFVLEFLYVFILDGTFGDFHVSAVASQGAVDLSDQLHVVEKRIEAIEVREADLVRSAATSNLGKDGNMKTIKHAVKWGSNYQVF